MKPNINNGVRGSLNSLLFNRNPSSAPEMPEDRSSGAASDNLDKYFLQARCKSNEIYKELDELYQECRLSSEYKSQYAGQIRKCFTAEGNGILYCIQQLGACCFEGNLFQDEKGRCEMIRYHADCILKQTDRINENSRSLQCTDSLKTPEKKGTNKTVLMNYLNAIHEAVSLIKDELNGRQDPVARFYERLWQETGRYLAALRDVLSGGDEGLREQMRLWYDGMCSILRRCGIDVKFYANASDEQRERWFTVKSEMQNIPAVVRTKCEIDEYIYFYGSWFNAEE